jgi:hypothetical protein
VKFLLLGLQCVTAPLFLISFLGHSDSVM